MNFVFALLIWLTMAVVIGVGVVMAAKGSPWLLLLSLLGFGLAIWRIGCAPH